MSDIVEKVTIKADGSQAKRESRTVEQRLGKMFDRSALKAAAFNQAMALGTRALGGMTEWLKQGVGAALEYERTTRQLGIVLRNLGDVGGHWAGILQGQSAELERLTGTSDEVIRKFQIMALNMGTSSDRVDDLVRASISLGNAMDIDVRTAMVQIVKTQTGLVEETLKSTRAVEGLSRAELEAGKAIDVINDKFGEQLDIMTQGTAGSAVGLATAWANLGESLGMFVTTAGVADVLGNIAEGLQNMADGLSRIRDLDALDMLRGYIGTLMAPLEAARIAFGIEDPLDALLGKGGDGGLLPLEALVKPGAVGGGKGAGKKGKKKDKGFQFSMGQDFGGEYLTAGGLDVLEGDEERFQARKDLFLQLEQEKVDGLAEIQQSQLDYQIGISDMIIADEERVSDAKKRLAAEAAQEQDRWAQFGARAIMTMARGAGGAIADWASGQEVSLGKIAGDMLSTIGNMLFAQGTMDVYKGISRALGSYGLDPTAAALIAHGGIETAAGLGMMGGGGAITATSSPAGGGSASGGGGGSADFAGGGGGSNSADSGLRQGGRTVIVNINGPVLNDHQFGTQVQGAIDEADRVGIG